MTKESAKPDRANWRKRSLEAGILASSSMTAILSPPSGAFSSRTAGATRRYRVLTIASHPVPYAAPVFRRLAQHPQLDFHVAYCSLRGAEAGLDSEFGRSVQWDVPLLNGYDWVHVPNRGSGEDSFFGLYNPGLWRLIRAGHFEAVMLHTGYVRASFWIAYLAARSCGAAFLFGTDAATLEPRDGKRWKRIVKRIVWPLLFRLADQVCSPSSASVELMRSLGIPGERISLTHFVVDNDWWTAQAAAVDRAVVRAPWGVTERELVVLFCAKLQPWKRPLDLLRAFARAGVPDAMLVYAGEGPLRAQLETEAAALCIRDRVRFLGFVNQSQLPPVYAASDVMVLPSSYEPFAVVVNEAMLCGCPVVASDRVGAARDLVIPNHNGLVYPCGDVEALAALLRKLLAERTTLVAMRENARQRLATWSPRENVAATVDAFAHAVRRRRGAPRQSKVGVLHKGRS